MSEFTDMNIIVTGGTRGIGAAISRRFLEAGARVTAIYGGNTAKADAFVAELGPLATRFAAQVVDTASIAEVEAFFRRYHEEQGELSVLVNSAGIRRDSALAMMSFEDWQRVIDVNLTGVFTMCKFAVQSMMRERYGRIINISSPSGKHGFRGQANYAASKAGMVALTRALSKETATRGITVNCVSPGFIETGFIADLPDDQKKAYRADVPMRRFGRAEEVAAAVGFLASREASYITGATLEVTGGL